MEIIPITEANDAIAGLAALFRVELLSYRGREASPCPEAAREEIAEYLAAGFPVFAAIIDGGYAGYMVCRVDGGTVWVESLYVREEFRRRGVASALHARAEEIAASCGGDTVYNCVHPNNHRIIAFLRKRGYTVLNLIEIRRPWRGEELTRTITVGEHEFDY